MKRAWIMVLALVLLLSGCGLADFLPIALPAWTDAQKTTLPTDAGGPIQPTKETAWATEESTQPSTEMATEPSTQATESLFEPYLVWVPNPAEPYYTQPGGAVAGTVEQAAKYTIVEERYYSGCLWGRLKSGVGWLNLCCLQGAPAAELRLTAEYASRAVLQNPDLRECGDPTQEYANPIAFHTNKTVREVSIYVLDLSWGYELGERIGTFGELIPDQPVVAWLTFPGDMSAYAISCRDGGQTRYYGVSISGLDGSVELWEFTP